MATIDPALERAKRHVKAVRDFYYHLMVFVLVNALLIIIDVGGGANDGFLGLDFAYWIVFVWGFGILGHAIYTFFGERRVSQVHAEERKRELTGRR
jgi:cellobiose-specific phosphotransferase system component IIC